MSDEVECRYHGRTFTPAEMALMRSLIEASPQNTRAGLAREFCHAINWVGTNGRIKVMAAKVTMLTMHRDHYVTPAHKRGDKTGEAEALAGDRCAARPYAAGIGCGAPDPFRSDHRGRPQGQRCLERVYRPLALPRLHAPCWSADAHHCGR